VGFAASVMVWYFMFGGPPQDFRLSLPARRGFFREHRSNTPYRLVCRACHTVPLLVRNAELGV